MFWNLSAPEVEQRKIASGPSDAVLVAYELSITELMIQRIVRIWEGIASPLANLTNKFVPQVSWEIYG